MKLYLTDFPMWNFILANNHNSNHAQIWETKDIQTVQGWILVLIFQMRITASNEVVRKYDIATAQLNEFGVYCLACYNEYFGLEEQYQNAKKSNPQNKLKNDIIRLSTPWQLEKHFSHAQLCSWHAFPRETFALSGIEDFMVDDGAIGAVEGHLYWIHRCGRTTGALVFNAFHGDIVHGFAGTSALRVNISRHIWLLWHYL